MEWKGMEWTEPCSYLYRYQFWMPNYVKVHECCAQRKNNAGLESPNSNR